MPTHSTRPVMRMRVIRAVVTCAVLCLAARASAQLLNMPESIIYDAAHGRYLLSNYATGDIVQIDESGTQAPFVVGMEAIQGLEIVGNTVYVGCDSTVRGFDLDSGEMVMHVSVPGVANLNDVTSDTHGNLYVSDVFGTKIIKVRISDQSQWTFVNGGGISNPNGIYFDRESNRILVCSYRPNSPIQAISLSDSTVSTVAPTNLSYCDGIVKDRYGNTYVTSWATLSIYRFDPAFSQPPELVYQNPAGAADISYDSVHDLIAIPLQLTNDYDLLAIEPLTVRFRAEPSTGHAPVTVQFFDESSSFFPIRSWTWDLDGDGLSDSEEQNPSWTYSEPGAYTVSLEVRTDSLANDETREDFIHVFEGESALFFDGSSSQATVPPAPSLDLVEQLTIEAWIRPYGWGEVSNSGLGRIVDKNRLALFVVGTSSTRHDSSLALVLFHESGGFSEALAPVNSVRLDQWQHIAVTYDAATSEVSMYVNGTAREVEYTRPPVGAIADHSAHPLVIGNSSGLATTFEGTIDELRIWSVCQTAEQIRSSMGHYLDGTEENLVAYWQMNEGSGDTLGDLSSEDNDALVVEALWRTGVDLSAVRVGPGVAHTQGGPKILCEVSPNPSAASTDIHLALPRPSHARIRIRDLWGRQIRSLFDGTLPAGAHTVRWDGVADHGGSTPAGVYVCTIETAKAVASRRILVIR